MTPAFNVLFLCTHNSARSIMAEALLEKIGRGRFRAYSAGADPAAAPLPEVIERLKALGHETSQLRCKSWNEFKGPGCAAHGFHHRACATCRMGNSAPISRANMSPPPGPCPIRRSSRARRPNGRPC